MHDSGVHGVVNGAAYQIVEPQLPFGYFIEHQGPIEGWVHTLEGVGAALDQIGPNFYHVNVPENGSVTVRTTAIVNPDPGDLQPCRKYLGFIRCCCDLSAGGGSSLGSFALPLGALALIMRRRALGSRVTRQHAR
jgi:hypothetical protein